MDFETIIMREREVGGKARSVVAIDIFFATQSNADENKPHSLWYLVPEAFSTPAGITIPAVELQQRAEKLLDTFRGTVSDDELDAIEEGYDRFIGICAEEEDEVGSPPRITFVP